MGCRLVNYLVAGLAIALGVGMGSLLDRSKVVELEPQSMATAMLALWVVRLVG